MTRSKSGARAGARPGAGSRTADVLLGLGVLLVFGLALAQTAEWSFRTALFPRMVTITGCALTVAFLAGCAVSALRRAPSEVADEQPPEQVLIDEDDEHDHAVEYVYATAGGRAWAQALAWVALFVTLLWVGGLFVSAGVFSLTYLRFGAGRTWRFSAVYAVVLAVVLYVALGLLLDVSVPEGLLG